MGKTARKGTFAALALTVAMTLSFGMPALVRASAAGTFDTPNLYNSEFDSRWQLSQAVTAFNKEVMEEGAVLLKNEEGALPLPQGAKVSIFGKTGQKKYDFATELSRVGFKVNSTLLNFYKDDAASGAGAAANPVNGSIVPGLNTGETPQSMFTQDVKSSFAEYNDAAVIVITRSSGEGWDIPRTMLWDGKTYSDWNADSTQTVPGARDGSDHYMQIDQNEADLIKMCGENFSKVIIFFCTNSSFETGFLDDPNHYAYHENVKAAFFVNYPRSLNGIGDILRGTVSPSGRTTDTWARDFKLDPTWQNFGNYLMDGADDVKGNHYTGIDGSQPYASNYVTYNEGIYVGYRYWETRAQTEGAEAYTSAAEGEKESCLDPASGGSAGKSKDYIHGTSTTSWKDWYSAHVVYPFGHGLSYTTFSQEIVSKSPEEGSALTEDGTVTLQVKVKNTGAVAGKDVVQLYYTAPYTAGQIEKAHVVLCAFEKTKLLQPGAEETLILSFKVRDMASYDYSDANINGFKGFELDLGDYTVRLMKNAHEEIENVSYTVSEGIRYETDDATGTKIENLFDDVSNYITEDLGQQYLSRNNWESTWPKFNKRLAASQKVIAGLNEWNIKGGTIRDPEKEKEEPYYTEVMPTTGVPSGITLSQLRGKAYNDPLWDTFLDQLTEQQLTDLAMHGYYKWGIDAPDLGIRQMANADGTRGLQVYTNGRDAHYGTQMALILASTWNRDLAYRFGQMIAEDALWSSNDKIGAWYAPAMNIHRSPFAGRNWEYYSEDGFISGVIATMEIKGAQEKGLPVYAKHFALNNCEGNRLGLITWANEQSMREIYFPAFEMCVKEGKALGVMSAFNRIGTTWTGGSYELLTKLLRDEWGFCGCVVTDSFPGNNQKVYDCSADQMIRAGGNLALGDGKLVYNVGTATTVSCLREAAHGLLYAQAHSLALNPYPQGNFTPIESFAGTMLDRGIVGVAYSAQVNTAKVSKTLYPDSDDSEIVYSVAEGSELPEGLTLSESGQLTGKPKKELNNYSFTVKASFKGYSKTAEFTISVVGANGSVVYERETDLGNLILNRSVDISLADATVYKPNKGPEEVLPACTYALSNGSRLPTGLTLTADGRLTGVPTVVSENYSFAVTAIAKGYGSVSLTFHMNIYRTMSFTGGALENAKLGESYVRKLPSAGAGVTYALAPDSELPNGLALTEGGYITGTPRETVTDHAFTVVATAPYTAPVEAEFTISVGLKFNSVRLPDGKTGEAYSARVDTAQGAGEVKYSVKEGCALPEGLTLSEDGVLGGTPAWAGSYAVTLVAEADGKVGDEITVTLYIAGRLPSGADIADGTAGGPLSTGAIIGIVAAFTAVSLGAGIAMGYFIRLKRRH